MAVVRNTRVGSGKIVLDQKMLYGSKAKKPAVNMPTLTPKYFLTKKYRNIRVPIEAKIEVNLPEYSTLYPGNNLSVKTAKKLYKGNSTNLYPCGLGMPDAIEDKSSYLG